MKYPIYLWNAFGLNPTPEYRFCPTRRFRFDFAFVESKVGVEIEGGIWIKGFSGHGGAHSLPSNIVRDMEKMNLAGKLGWRVFRFQPNELKKGIAQSFILEVMKGV